MTANGIPPNLSILLMDGVSSLTDLKGIPCGHVDSQKMAVTGHPTPFRPFSMRSCPVSSRPCFHKLH